MEENIENQDLKNENKPKNINKKNTKRKEKKYTLS